MTACLSMTFGCKRGHQSTRALFPLTMRGEQSSYLGSLPYDAAWRLSPVILTGGFRYIYLHGSAMYRGIAQIHSIGFYEEFDVEDA